MHIIRKQLRLTVVASVVAHPNGFIFQLYAKLRSAQPVCPAQFACVCEFKQHLLFYDPLLWAYLYSHRV